MSWSVPLELELCCSDEVTTLLNRVLRKKAIRPLEFPNNGLHG